MECISCILDDLIVPTFQFLLRHCSLRVHSILYIASMFKKYSISRLFSFVSLHSSSLVVPVYSCTVIYHFSVSLFSFTCIVHTSLIIHLSFLLLQIVHFLLCLAIYKLFFHPLSSTLSSLLFIKLSCLIFLANTFNLHFFFLLFHSLFTFFIRLLEHLA